MMTLKHSMLLFVSVCLISFLACENQAPPKKKPASQVVSGKITQPAAAQKPETKPPPDMPKPSAETKGLETSAGGSAPVDLKTPDLMPDDDRVAENDHYDSAGKIDPFLSLIQESSEEKPVVDNRPKRPLTPLEKIELSQIRLVAVILMKDRKIAMVEEASGKGYEIGIGTYIGKNQGRVSDINKNGIVVKEIVRDFKGKLREKVQEIKLHKNVSEE